MIGELAFAARGRRVVETFFEQPILNPPYEVPTRHHDLDEDRQPTNLPPILGRRCSKLITPVPKPRKRKRGSPKQAEMIFADGEGLTDAEQEYNPTPIINEIRDHVDAWRNLPNPNDWQVTPATARLLQHWRHHRFESVRPFFCQVEAVETIIWLTEVAPKLAKAGTRRFERIGKIREHILAANERANPELVRVAMKMATGAGKTPSWRC
jgi:type III restriction enzyme